MPQALSVIIEHDEHGYFASCPALEGCHTQGDTFEQATANIREAIELYLSTLDDNERRALVSRQIFTTTMEIQVA